MIHVMKNAVINNKKNVVIYNKGNFIIYHVKNKEMSIIKIIFLYCKGSIEYFRRITLEIPMIKPWNLVLSKSDDVG